VQPLFASKNLDTLFTNMADVVDRYMASKHVEGVGHRTSLDREMKRLTQQVMVSTLMHSRISSDDTDTVTRALDDALSAVNLRTLLFFLPDFVPLPGELNLLARSDDTVGGFRVSAGSTLLISPYVTHRLPTIWQSPESFDPERFSPERSARRHRFAHFPFGIGPRQCIGMNFAMMEMQLILARMAPRLRPVRMAGPPAEPRSVLTLQPARDVPVRFVAD